MDVGCVVQAIDPACGSWIRATVVDIKNGQYCVKWSDYPKVDNVWLQRDQVRHPEKRRQLRIEIKPSDWPTLRAPRNIQRGDSVKYKLADGSIGDKYVVDFNDCFKCEVKAVCGRILRYEYIVESDIGIQVPQPSTTKRQPHNNSTNDKPGIQHVRRQNRTKGITSTKQVTKSGRAGRQVIKRIANRAKTSASSRIVKASANKRAVTAKTLANKKIRETVKTTKVPIHQKKRAANVQVNKKLAHMLAEIQAAEDVTDAEEDDNNDIWEYQLPKGETVKDLCRMADVALEDIDKRIAERDELKKKQSAAKSRLNSSPRSPSPSLAQLPSSPSPSPTHSLAPEAENVHLTRSTSPPLNESMDLEDMVIDSPRSPTPPRHQSPRSPTPPRHQSPHSPTPPRLQSPRSPTPPRLQSPRSPSLLFRPSVLPSTRFSPFRRQSLSSVYLQSRSPSFPFRRRSHPRLYSPSLRQSPHRLPSSIQRQSPSSRQSPHRLPPCTHRQSPSSRQSPNRRPPSTHRQSPSSRQSPNRLPSSIHHQSPSSRQSRPLRDKSPYARHSPRNLFNVPSSSTVEPLSTSSFRPWKRGSSSIDFEARLKAAEDQLEVQGERLLAAEETIEKLVSLLGFKTQRGPKSSDILETTYDDKGQAKLSFKQSVLNEVSYLLPDSVAIARKLARLVFSDEERVDSNCRGVRGKRKMDNRKVEAIHKAVINMTPGRSSEREGIWQRCVQAIDTYNRNLTRTARKKGYE